MKVWIVTWHDYDGWGIVGVHDSCEKAEAEADRERRSDPDYTYLIDMEEVQ